MQLIVRASILALVAIGAAASTVTSSARTNTAKVSPQVVSSAFPAPSCDAGPAVCGTRW